MSGGSGETITALAHPSSLFIGTTHGVYVMEEQAGRKTQEVQEVLPCREVLQKPTEELMRSRGAVVERGGREVVYSDSAFWFPSSTARRLVSLHGQVAPLTTELCIYGDLLTCLGESRDKHYVARLLSKEADGSEGIAARRAMYHSLGDTGLAVLALHSSRFHHLGTTAEYLEGLTRDPHLRKELSLEQVVSSRVAQGAGDQVAGILLHSALSSPATIPTDSIVEYSIIEAPIHLGPCTILSGVHVTKSMDLPAGFLYHTVPVVVDNTSKFVTVAFHHLDDMKKSTKQAMSGSLSYGERPMEELYSSGLLDLSATFPSDGPASLWTARLFPAASTMADSLAVTAAMVARLRTPTTTATSGVLYSMDDLVQLKDGPGILKFRRTLAATIKN